MHTGFLAVPALFSALRWQKKRLQNQWERSCARSQEGAAARPRCDPSPSTRVRRTADSRMRGNGMVQLGKRCCRVTWQDTESDSVLATSPALSPCEYMPDSTKSLCCLFHSIEMAWTSPQNLSLGNFVSKTRPGLWGISSFTLKETGGEETATTEQTPEKLLQQGELLQETLRAAPLLGSFKTKQEKASCRDQSCPGPVQVWGALSCRSNRVLVILESLLPETQSEPGPQGQTLEPNSLCRTTTPSLPPEQNFFNLCDMG